VQLAAQWLLTAILQPNAEYQRRTAEKQKKENSIEDRQYIAMKIQEKIRKGGENLCHTRRSVVSFCGKYTFVKSRRDLRAASRTPTWFEEKCDSETVRTRAGAQVLHGKSKIAASPGSRSRPAIHP